MWYYTGRHKMCFKYIELKKEKIHSRKLYLINKIDYKYFLLHKTYENDYYWMNLANIGNEQKKGVINFTINYN